MTEIYGENHSGTNSEENLCSADGRTTRTEDKSVKEVIATNNSSSNNKQQPSDSPCDELTAKVLTQRDDMNVGTDPVQVQSKPKSQSEPDFGVRTLRSAQMNWGETKKDTELTCRDCTYSTTSRISMNRHKLIHLYETRFECPECHHTFGEKSIYELHTKMHEKNKRGSSNNKNNNNNSTTTKEHSSKNASTSAASSSSSSSARSKLKMDKDKDKDKEKDKNKDKDKDRLSLAERRTRRKPARFHRLCGRSTPPTITIDDDDDDDDEDYKSGDNNTKNNGKGIIDDAEEREIAEILHIFDDDDEEEEDTDDSRRRRRQKKKSKKALKRSRTLSSSAAAAASKKRRKSNGEKGKKYRKKEVVDDDDEDAEDAEDIEEDGEGRGGYKTNGWTSSSSFRYVCTHPGCSYGCNSLSRIKDHMLNHTAEKRFKCKLCNSRFKRKYGLERHCNNTHGLSD